MKAMQGGLYTVFIRKSEPMANTQFHRRSVRLPLYKIVDKKKQTIPFRRNPTQAYLETTKKRLKEKFGRIRLVILKGRQAGITTHEAILGLDQAIIRSNQKVGMLAHTDETRKSIFEKVKFAFREFPDAIQLNNGKIFTKPQSKYDTKYELTLKDNNSSIAVVRDPRGSTRSKLHISEMAFIKNAGDMLAGTLPSVPESIIETTANGFGNDFEKLWTKYADKGDNRERTCLFLPWYMVEEYSLPLQKGEKVIVPLELKHLNEPLWNGYVLSEEQKKWYLEQYGTYTDPRMMFQEYPSTPEEAFLTTGTSVFSSQNRYHISISMASQQINVYSVAIRVQESKEGTTVPLSFVIGSLVLFWHHFMRCVSHHTSAK